MITAGDGEEALRVARRERPDLVVLDVRLPKRSGLEVCEALRRDPDDPDVPMLMVSAMAEVDARVQGFARGADDYLVKPFSPRELVARIQRLIARAGDARHVRRMGVEAEIELRRTRDEVQRGQHALRHARDVRAHTAWLSEHLASHGDPDRLVDEYLSQVMGRFDAGRAWLVPPPAGAAEPMRACGRGLPPSLGLAAMPRHGGELCRFVGSVGRPVRAEDLSRLPELKPEAGALLAAGLVLALPIGEGAQAGLLALADPSDARPLGPDDRELLAAWNGAFASRFAAACDTLASAEAWLALLADWSVRGLDARATRLRGEAAAAADAAAETLGLGPRDRWLVRWCTRLLPLADAEAIVGALERAASREGAGRTAELAELAAVVADPAACDDPAASDVRLPLLRAASAWVHARAAGRDPDAAASHACEDASADAETREAIRGAFARAGSPPCAAA